MIRCSFGAVRRILILVIAVGAVVAACSSSSSLTDFAEDLERLVSTMNDGLDDADASLGDEPSLEVMRAYVADRLELRNDFLDAFGALDPPEEISDLYATALDIIVRLTAAESELADFVMEADTAEEARTVWDSPAGDAARAIDVESIAICDAAQASVDATQDRDSFSDTPWIPPEMKEVIEVTFGCHAEDR